jgi:hypothetical protein
MLSPGVCVLKYGVYFALRPGREAYCRILLGWLAQTVDCIPYNWCFFCIHEDQRVTRAHSGLRSEPHTAFSGLFQPHLRSVLCLAIAHIALESAATSRKYARSDNKAACG